MRPEVLQTLCNAALDPAAHKPGDGGLARLSEGIFLGVLNPRAPLPLPQGTFASAQTKYSHSAAAMQKTFHCASGKLKAARRTPGGRKTISAFQSGISLCGGFYKSSPSHKKNDAAQWHNGSKALFKFRFAFSKLNSAARMKRSRRYAKNAMQKMRRKKNAAGKIRAATAAFF